MQKMLKKFPRAKLVFLGFFVVLFALFSFVFFGANSAFASNTEGTIDGTHKYAWGENIGWINFGCDNCDVGVTDTGLSGQAWSSEYGWINLDPDTSGVSNNAEGTLSGFAWSPNLGWINFSGVTINTSGEFLGYATVKSDNSQINFNCAGGIDSCGSANFKVQTDWRPASARNVDDGSGSVSVTRSRTTSSLSTQEIFPPVAENPPADNFFSPILNFFRPKSEPVTVVSEIPKITPLAFMGEWDLLPTGAINAFVFAPLPYEVRILASKFPELDKTLKSVDVHRMTDLTKLSGITLNLPGLSELTNTLKNIGAGRLAQIDKLNGVSLDIPGLSNPDQKILPNIGVGKIALIEGLPLANFSLVDKRNLPAEFVFARASGELIDLNVAMSIGDKGEVVQKISTLPGQTMRLVVKPIGSASSVTGYIVFKSATPKVAEGNQNEISRSSLLASALFASNDLVEKNPEPISVENKLVLSSFEYTDPDRDGIYTADVVSPVVPGEYEVITVIDYIDPVLGTRQMRMITVIDPEGYVFEKNNGKETRIPSAIVSLYSLNVSTKSYELWPAKDYSQENPQITDVRGTYSFLVPEGSYYFSVEAPGYEPYEGKAFVVTSGAGIHENIELRSSGGWLSSLTGLDWKTILLVVVLLLLVYNSVRSRLRQ
ncbi:hypothetical protein A2738_00770 [Candidatus Nomurabacteria bacterium RIFCSPHIGHO2_01_FULL_42_15]|uniref:Carboxypeptidase regulatory-like domain-containing protein n=1 Tax=Candidatus Nomurabacteria bacterium RIFCSPHIGHO2_01_FULL_42_15 TaxID=1801742 RepID=A0A1F6VFJ0_9BACT|nr:MAG: hypothetical protein A2738_00770 [Candidatus Nomurabacteria bacterium RIFCSPHIGHO2_01_FULL_42_15]OGI93169.1 MAG: hypothetical protein A3A99_01400 [Candidatus Nomurabacteria bacterium RIFCSPLOWO2_01_FULL_41_18]